MWGLPDSAILGTIKSLKSHKGGNRGSAVAKPKTHSITLAQSWECFNQDTRSFEEILAKARLSIEKRHAQQSEKLQSAGRSVSIYLLAKGAKGSREKMKTEAKFIRRRIAVGLIALALIAWAFDATTPEMCKVPTEQMNQFCLDLLYP